MMGNACLSTPPPACLMEEEGTRSSMRKRGQVAAPFLPGMKQKQARGRCSVAVLQSVTPGRKFKAARDSARPSRVRENAPLPPIRSRPAIGPAGGGLTRECPLSRSSGTRGPGGRRHRREPSVRRRVVRRRTHLPGLGAIFGRTANYFILLQNTSRGGRVR